MRPSGKGSKEWKVLIKYKQQTCICSRSNHVELKLAYRPLSLVSSGSFLRVLLPLRVQNHEPHPPLIGFGFVYFPAADFRDVSRFDVELLGNAM